MHPTRARGNPSCVVESLEDRQLLAAQPWSPAARLIGQDLAAAKYPSLTGAGEAVVVIDSGVDYKHPVLGGGFGPSFKVEAGWDFMQNDGDPMPDTFAHGTGVAGVLAANGYVYNGVYNQGIAPGVKLIALRQSNSAEVKAALQWVLNNRAKYNIVAVNLTDYGGPGPSAYAGVFKQLVAAGVFIAHPSGNAGAGTPVGPAVDPADYSVGSVNLSGQMSSFTQRGAELDLLAPGEGVTVPYYDTAKKTNTYLSPTDGTSWASPAVTGTAALIKQIDSRFTPAQIMKIMQDSGASVYDSASKLTYKRLNVNAALALAYQRKGSGTQPPSSTGPTPTPAPTPKPTPAPVPTQSPYSGTATRIVPDAVFQAENFDKGGEGVAYHDADSTNLGGNKYRTDNAGVDVESTVGGGVDVTSFRVGEWMEYTVNVATAGTYTLTARVASKTGGGKFHVEVDGVDKTGAMIVPNTANNQNWSAVGKSGVQLTAGTHVLRVKADAAGADGLIGNIDWIKFSQMSGTIAATSFSSQSGVAVSGDHIGSLAQGDWAGYKGINFGAGASTFTASVAVPKAWAGGKVLIRLDSATGPVIGTLTLSSTGADTFFQAESTGITRTSGVHDVYLTFAGVGWVGNIQSFRFT